MGFKKLGIVPEKGLYIPLLKEIYEGMDYTEFKTLISDLSYWADQLDDLFASAFWLSSVFELNK